MGFVLSIDIFAYIAAHHCLEFDLALAADDTMYFAIISGRTPLYSGPIGLHRHLSLILTVYITFFTGGRMCVIVSIPPNGAVICS